MTSQLALDFTKSPYFDGKVGYTRHGTSEQAAQKTEKKAKDIRETVYSLVLAAGANGLTADECAKILGLKVTQVRPRFSELSSNKKGHVPVIKDFGRTRLNEDGNLVTVWVAI